MGARGVAVWPEMDEEFYEELEEALILADVGVETSVELVERLRDAVGSKDQRYRTGKAGNDRFAVGNDGWEERRIMSIRC